MRVITYSEYDAICENFERREALRFDAPVLPYYPSEQELDAMESNADQYIDFLIYLDQCNPAPITPQEKDCVKRIRRILNDNLQFEDDVNDEESMKEEEEVMAKQPDIVMQLIARARKKGVSLKQVALDAGFTEDVISGWGKDSSNLTPEQLDTLNKVLGVDTPVNADAATEPKPAKRSRKTTKTDEPVETVSSDIETVENLTADQMIERTANLKENLKNSLSTALDGLVDAYVALYNQVNSKPEIPDNLKELIALAEGASPAAIQAACAVLQSLKN